MKTEKLVKIIRCDSCQREVSDNGEKYFGSSPFHDWIHLSIHTGSSYVGEMNKKREFDFCSMECLYKFSVIKTNRECIIPLQRNQDGKLSVVVNVNTNKIILDTLIKDIQENGSFPFSTRAE